MDIDKVTPVHTQSSSVRRGWCMTVLVIVEIIKITVIIKIIKMTVGYIIKAIVNIFSVFLLGFR